MSVFVDWLESDGWRKRHFALRSKNCAAALKRPARKAYLASTPLQCWLSMKNVSHKKFRFPILGTWFTSQIAWEWGTSSRFSYLGVHAWCAEVSNILSKTNVAVVGKMKLEKKLNAPHGLEKSCHFISRIWCFQFLFFFKFDILFSV